MSRAWRLLGSGAAVALLLAGCGKSTDVAGADAPVVQRPVSDPTPTVGATPAADVAAEVLLGALDKLDATTAAAREARAKAAAKAAAAEGVDRVAALTAVKAACSELRTAYTEFSSAVRAAPFAETARPAVDALLDATGKVITVIDLYSGADAVEEIRTLNDRETAATADWEKAAGALALGGV